MKSLPYYYLYLLIFPVSIFSKQPRNILYLEYYQRSFPHAIGAGMSFKDQFDIGFSYDGVFAKRYNYQDHYLYWDVNTWSYTTTIESVHQLKGGSVYARYYLFSKPRIYSIFEHGNSWGLLQRITETSKRNIIEKKESEFGLYYCEINHLPSPFNSFGLGFQYPVHKNFSAFIQAKRQQYSSGKRHAIVIPVSLKYEENILLLNCTKAISGRKVRVVNIIELAISVYLD